ncbi:MAG: S-layer homology domain-containing protein [Clostridia bacterium]|nr:S-layer homology domain-containing protein [Clostridia bacterium]
MIKSEETEIIGTFTFKDVDSISEYTIASMQYASGSGLMKGKTASTLNPKDNATRAEIAAIFHRFIEANK